MRAGEHMPYINTSTVLTYQDYLIKAGYSQNMIRKIKNGTHDTITDADQKKIRIAFHKCPKIQQYGKYSYKYD